MFGKTAPKASTPKPSATLAVQKYYYEWTGVNPALDKFSRLEQYRIIDGEHSFRH
jgi:hypothetical protein